MRGRFMRRVGAFMVVMLLVLLLFGAAVVWAVATLLGTQASTLLAGLVVLLLFSFIARRLVRGVRGSAVPAADLIEAAGRVESGDYTARVREQGPRELRALGRAFNTMSARLEATEEERRRLLSDVSHELRTPLTVIAGNLEGLLDGVYPADAAHLRTILEETRILGRLVEDLRTLSESEAGALQLHLEPTDLARLLHEVADGFRAQADGGHVLLETSAGELPTLELDATRIRAVVGNLLANALRYTPQGGQISVGAEPAGAPWRSQWRTPGQGSSRRRLRTSSTASTARPIRREVASAWRLRGASSRRTAGRSQPRRLGRTEAPPFDSRCQSPSEMGKLSTPGGMCYAFGSPRVPWAHRSAPRSLPLIPDSSKP